ncbi:MAG: hypothetical protein ACD_45C00684G0003 [uncultured bacterium]|nr:MAG: hypothetical protein ACD_45C00684G0003 [uncultured bacterium]
MGLAQQLLEDIQEIKKLIHEDNVFFDEFETKELDECLHRCETQTQQMYDNYGSFLNLRSPHRIKAELRRSFSDRLPSQSAPPVMVRRMSTPDCIATIPNASTQNSIQQYGILLGVIATLKQITSEITKKTTALQYQQETQQIEYKKQYQPPETPHDNPEHTLTDASGLIKDICKRQNKLSQEIQDLNLVVKTTLHETKSMQFGIFSHGESQKVLLTECIQAIADLKNEMHKVIKRAKPKSIKSPTRRCCPDL